MTSMIEVKPIDCPHCKGKIDVEIERKPAKVHIEKVEDANIPVSELDAVVEKALSKREQDKVKQMPQEEIKVPDYLPYIHCKSGNCDQPGHLHRNKKARKQLRRKCERCDQLNPEKSKGCATCGKVFEEDDDFTDLDNDELEERGIPIIEVGEHDHEHE